MPIAERFPKQQPQPAADGPQKGPPANDVAPNALELVTDQDTEEVDLNRREVVLTTIRTLDRYRARLDGELEEVASELRDMRGVYDRLLGRYQHKRNAHRDIQAAIERVNALIGEVSADDHETAYRAARATEKQLAQLQEELHQRGIVPLTEGLSMETAPVAPDILHLFERADELGASMEKSEVGEPILTYETAGFAKKHEGLEGKVGEYGQDSAIVNPVAGIVMQIDGSTSIGPESYRAGVIYGEKVHDILSGIPAGETDPERIKEYIQQRYATEMKTVLNWMPHEDDLAGGCVMVAMRVLPEAGVVVTFRIGDGYMAMKQGDEVRELSPQSGGKIQSKVQGVGILKSRIQADTRAVNATPTIQVISYDTSQDLELFAVSDGIEKLPEKPSVTDLLERGGAAAVSNIDIPKHPDDDLLAVHARIAA